MTTVVLAWAPKRRNIFIWKYKPFGSFLGGRESSRQCRRHGFDPWSGKIPPGLKQLSPCPTSIGPGAQEPGSHNYGARELQLPKLECPRAHALQQENPLQWQVRAPRLENSSRSPQLEKSLHSNETQHSQKQWINTWKLKQKIQTILNLPTPRMHSLWLSHELCLWKVIVIIIIHDR